MLTSPSPRTPSSLSTPPNKTSKSYSSSKSSLNSKSSSNNPGKYLFDSVSGPRADLLVGTEVSHSQTLFRSDYSLAFASNDSLLEEGDVKCVNSTNLTHTIRTVFAAYLWHYSSGDYMVTMVINMVINIVTMVTMVNMVINMVTMVINMVTMVNAQ